MILLNRVVRQFEEGGVILEEGGVAILRGWFGTLMKVVWYIEDGDVVL